MLKSMSPAGRRYTFRIFVAMAVYVMFLTFSIRALKTDPPTGPLLYLVALMPALPILGVIGILAAYLLEEEDEFRRAKVVQAMLGGLALVLGVTTVWGFLEGLAAVPHVPLYLVFPLWAAGMGVSTAVVEWRYR